MSVIYVPRTILRQSMSTWRREYNIKGCGFEDWQVDFINADPGLQDPVLWLQYTNTQGLQKSCGEKGMAWPVSK